MYSLSEIEAMSRKALRGTGYSWGHAEEGGKAIRWLSTYQLPGVVALAHYLQAHATRPDFAQDPFMQGGFICDQGSAWQVHTLHIAYPLLLLPYLAWWASSQQQAVCVTWETHTLVVNTEAIVGLPQESAACFLQSQADIQFTLHSSAELTSHSRQALYYGQAIDTVVWQVLEERAQRTYVPASDASRHGAGPAD